MGVASNNLRYRQMLRDKSKPANQRKRQGQVPQGADNAFTVQTLPAIALWNPRTLTLPHRIIICLDTSKVL
jgi:hypothetical protein